MVSPTPDVGDVVWLNDTPQAGREQAGRRPALVLSPRAYNEKTGLMVACAITSRSKGYVFEVPMPAESSIKGVILADQVKSVDWRQRCDPIAERVPEEILSDILAKIRALLNLG